MRATAILREEHTVLRRVLRSLEVVVDEVQRTGTLDERAALDIVEFLERFVDGSHQAKEEDLMLRALEVAERGDALQELVALFELHTEERSLLEATRGALERALDGDSWGLDEFVQRARKYAQLQYRHARGEDHVLFPQLEQLLEEEDERPLLRRFTRIEASYRRRGDPDPACIAADLCARVGLLRDVAVGSTS